MRIINQTSSILILSNDMKTSIRLNPGEVSQQFNPSIKVIYQAILGRNPNEIAIISESSLDDAIIQKVKGIHPYVHNSVEEALTKLKQLSSIEVKEISGTNLKIEDFEMTQRKLNEALKTIESLNNDILIKNKSISSLDSQLEEKIAEVNRLNSKVEGIESQFKTESTNSLTRINNLEESLKLKQSEYNILLTENKELLARIDSISNQESDPHKIEEMESAIKELTTNIEIKDAELDKVTKLYNSLLEDSQKAMELWNKACDQYGLVFNPESSEWTINPNTTPIEAHKT